MVHANYETAVKIAQLDSMLSANARTTITNVVLATIFIYIQSDILPSFVAVSWMAAMVIVNVVRFLIGWQYIKAPVSEIALVKKRIFFFRVGIILCAILWGATTYLVDWTSQFWFLIFVIYMVAGLSASAVVVYSIDPVSASSYLVFAVMPMLVIFAFSNNPALIAMSLSGLAYVVFMGLGIRAFHRNFLEGVKLRLDALKHTDEIQQLAFYDALTDLPNRRLLLDRLKESLVSSKRSGKGGAVLFLDLDHFKTLNDTLGHNMGDILLQQVARRLEDSVRASDTVARFGGDEFVVMVDDLNEDNQLALKDTEDLAKVILANLNQPYLLEDTDYSITPSIGVALYWRDGESEDDLLKHADVAMYHAKKTGRNKVSIFDREMLNALEAKQ